MYQLETITDKDRMANLPGHPLTAQQVASAQAVEVWCSSFNDPGEDYNEFRLIVNGTVTECVRVAGY